MFALLLRRLLVAAMATVLAFGGAGMAAAGMQKVAPAGGAPPALHADAGSASKSGGCSGHEAPASELPEADCCTVLCHIAIVTTGAAAADPLVFALPGPALRLSLVVATSPYRLDRPPKP